MRKGYATGNSGKELLDFDKASPRKGQKHEINRIFVFFSVKDRNLFHFVNNIGNIFTSGAAMKYISIFH